MSVLTDVGNGALGYKPDVGADLILRDTEIMYATLRHLLPHGMWLEDVGVGRGPRLLPVDATVAPEAHLGVELEDARVTVKYVHVGDIVATITNVWNAAVPRSMVASYLGGKANLCESCTTCPHNEPLAGPVIVSIKRVPYIKCAFCPFVQGGDMCPRASNGTGSSTMLEPSTGSSRRAAKKRAKELEQRTVRACSGCEAVFYCGSGDSSCQKNDWKQHKHICRRFAKATPSSSAGGGAGFGAGFGDGGEEN